MHKASPLLAALALLAGCSSSSGTASSLTPTTPALQHILFVGDSYTYGRYAPVRLYDNGGTANVTTGSALVVDENFGQTGARAESSTESGPWSGIPALFAQFAVESGLDFDVHLEAISSTSLQNNYAAAPTVIAQSQWNAVVLQEISTRPLSHTLTADSTSNPSNFCTTVQTIEKAVHTSAPSARVYLYETWPRGDMAQSLSGLTTSSSFAANYAANLATIGAAYHNVYYSAATHDGNITAVAPAGEAWTRAWSQSIANSNPYTTTSTLPLLWYGINPSNDPAITAADYAHPSIYGAYLSALVLFQQITGTDPRSLGPTEKAAAALGISTTIAAELQDIAWETVSNESSTPINQTVDPCTLTS